MSANRHATIYQDPATVQKLSQYNINLRYNKHASYCLETDLFPNEGRNLCEKIKVWCQTRGQINKYTHTHTHTHIREYNEKNASKCLGTAHNIKSVICIVLSWVYYTHFTFHYFMFYSKSALWPISYDAKMIVAKMLKAKILDTNQTRAEINEMGNRKITERTSEANCWFYEKINRIPNNYRHTSLLYFTLLCFADTVFFYI